MFDPIAEYTARWHSHAMQVAKFDATADDLLAAYRLNFKIRLKAKRARRNLMIGCLFLSVLSVFAAWLWDLGSLPIAAAVGAVYWVLFLVAVFGAAYLRLRGQSRTIYAQQKNLHGTTFVEWDDRGIKFGSIRGQSNFEWDDFYGIFANAEVIILKQSADLMNFIPTRALTDDQVVYIAGRRTGQS